MAKENNTLRRAEFNYKFAILTIYAKLKGISFIVFRHDCTAEEQNQKFKEGKTLCDGYEKVSLHQLDRAKDLVIIDKKGNPIWKHVPEYDILAQFWQGLDEECVWGGQWYIDGKTRFNDCFHFQY